MPSHTETQWTDRIFAVREPDEFNALAIELFQWQAKYNPVYRTYLQHLGVAPASIQHPEQIPHLPIAFFKTHEVLLEGHEAALTFRSSGTTGSTPSLHQLHDPSLYQRSFREGFRLAYGAVDNYCLLALLPTYLERQDASLAYMAKHLIDDTGHPDSGFYLDQLDRLQATLQRLEAAGQPVLLLGVSFALLDLAEQMTFPLRHTVVMETGGMKGRRREMVREELHRA
ncbi:MAG: acyl transferase, partial [Bacteroidota bacterium]